MESFLSMLAGWFMGLWTWLVELNGMLQVVLVLLCVVASGVCAIIGKRMGSPMIVESGGQTWSRTLVTAIAWIAGVILMLISRDASRRSVGAAVLAAAEDREHGQRRASAEQGQQARREHGREDPMAAGPAHCVFLSDQKGFCPPTTTSTVRQGCWTVPYPVAEITVYASSPAFT